MHLLYEVKSCNKKGSLSITFFDHVLERVVSHEFYHFLDCFSGYYQIENCFR